MPVSRVRDTGTIWQADFFGVPSVCLYRIFTVSGYSPLEAHLTTEHPAIIRAAFNVIQATDILWTPESRISNLCLQRDFTVLRQNPKSPPCNARDILGWNRQSLRATPACHRCDRSIDRSIGSNRRSSPRPLVTQN